MSNIEYPSTLPCPAAASFQEAERRGLSSLPGARQSRVLSRDRFVPSQPLEFILRSEQQVQDWVDFGASLGNWAHWFAAEWPQPQGGVGVRQFIGVPSYPQYLPVIKAWRVSATVQVRGRGELPAAYLSLAWDAADKSPLALLSDGDLSVTIIDASFRSKWALCTLALGSGKWMFEIEVTGTTGVAVTAWRPGLGLGTKGFAWGSGDPDSGNDSPDDGSKVWTQNASLNATQLIGGGPSFDNGDRLSFVADLDARKMWLYKNGSIVQGDPVAGTGHSIALLPAIQAPLLAPLYWNELPNASVKLITSPRDFVTPVPDGFTAWGN